MYEKAVSGVPSVKSQLQIVVEGVAHTQVKANDTNKAENIYKDFYQSFVQIQL